MKGEVKGAKLRHVCKLDKKVKAAAVGMLPLVGFVIGLAGAAIAADVTAPTGVYSGLDAVTDAGTPYGAWLGVRYATAERFQEAKLVRESKERFDVTKPAEPCLQQDGDKIKGSEDCLSLKIYAPKDSSGLPVIVYFSGGRFLKTREVEPDYFIDTKKVIYVIAQNRLNVLGFLDFGSDKFPSNLGLKDLVVALKWIQQNIEAFGGDPKSVTIQGQSTGAATVQLLMYSPLTKGLFHGGISESGTACTPFALVPPTTARRTLTRVANLTGCPAPPSSGPAADTAKCLLKKSSDELGNALLKFTEGTGNNGTERLFTVRPYQPVLESSDRKGAFITEYPWKTNRTQVPWLTGINSYEGYNIFPSFNVPYDKVVEQRNLSVLPILLLYRDTALSPNTITEEIKRFYLGFNFTDDADVKIFYDKVVSDNMFNFPMEQCLNLHQESKAWVYFFGYRNEEMNDAPGIPHAGELEYLFKTRGKDLRATGSDQDKKISRTLLDLLVSFATSHKGGTEDIQWNPWTKEARNSLVLDEHGVRQLELPFKNRINFWLNLPFRNKLLHS